MSGPQGTTLQEMDQTPPDGVRLSRQSGLNVPSGPHTSSLDEPWALITVGGQSIDFLLDTRATYSAITEAPGPLSS